MKADIHPDYHEISIVMTDGSEYKTQSTYGKAGDKITLDVDPLTHPAWQGGSGLVVEKGQLDKFESKYGSFLSGGTAKKEAPKEEKKEAAQEEKTDDKES